MFLFFLIWNAEFHNISLRNLFYLEHHSQVFKSFQDKFSQGYCAQIINQMNQRVLLGQHRKIFHHPQDLSWLLAHIQPTAHSGKQAAESIAHCRKIRWRNDQSPWKRWKFTQIVWKYWHVQNRGLVWILKMWPDAGWATGCNLKQMLPSVTLFSSSPNQQNQGFSHS